MTRAQPTKTSPKDTVHTSEVTLIDHLHELRTRLFWVFLTLLLATSASYLLKDQIMSVIMNPLGGQQLVYLTPIGGFNFIFKVSLYFGLLVILPVAVYHLYRFLEPLMPENRKRSGVFFIIASFLLAVAGGSFAYFAGLPAALHFLTGFTIQNVSAMLTVESYLAFVVAYVLGFAVLFQIPLILMIINTITPLPPKKLLGFMRFVVLGAFIAAAIISPTPDATNQAILAVPIVTMYLVGVGLVALQSKTDRRRERRQAKPTQTPMFQASAQPARPATPVIAPVHAVQVAATQHASRPAASRQRPVMDIMTPRRITRPAQPLSRGPIRASAVRPVPVMRQAPRQHPMRQSHSIDGIITRSQPLSQAG